MPNINQNRSNNQDTVDTFFNTHSGFNRKQSLMSNSENNFFKKKAKFDRNGSPFKRYMVGTVEMYEKEKMKRSTILPNKGRISKLFLEISQIEVKKKLPRNRLKDNNKAKSLTKKQESKLPRFIMTKFSDQAMHEFIQNYHERRYLSTIEDKSSIFGSTMYSHHRHGCLSVDREMRDSRYLENYNKMTKRWQKYANFLSK